MNVAIIKILSQNVKDKDPFNLLDAKFINQEFNDYQKAKEGGRDVSVETAKNYTHALSHFIDFLEFEYQNYIQISTSTLSSLKSSIKKIGKSFKSKSKAKLEKKHEPNLEVMPSVKDIQKYEKSKERENIKQLINEFDHQAGKKLPSKHQVSSILGYLFIERCLNNGCRTGEITNLTMDHFKKRTQFPNGYFVLKVSDHKTALTPARA